MKADFTHRLILFLAACICMCLPVRLMAQSVPAKGKPPAPAANPSAAAAPPALPPAVKQAAALFDRAARLQRAGKLDAALAAYRDFLRQAQASHLKPGASVLAYRNMLPIYRFRGDAHAEEQTLKQIVALQPDDAASWAALAVIASGRRDYATARADADKALRLKPTAAAAAPAHFALGLVALGKLDFAQAAEELGQAVRLAPTNVGGHYYDALALTQLKRYPQALAEAEKARQLQPKMIPARVLIAAIKQDTNDLPGALTAYTEVLALDPHNRIALFNRALGLQKLGRVNDAIKAYLSFVAVYPDDAEAQINLGLLYANLQNYSSARQHFLIGVQALKQANSHDARGLIDLAAAEMQLALNTPLPAQRTEMFKQTAAHLQEAQALDPGNKRLPYQLADVYRRSGRYAQALAIYQKLRDASPDDKAAYFGIADTYVMQGRHQDALDTWRAYRKRKPNDPISYEECARFLELENRWSDAAQENEQLTTLDPQDGDALLALARDYVQMGQPEKAEPYYKKLLTFDVTAGDRPAAQRPGVIGARQTWRMAAWQGLADLADRQGNLDLAISDLQKARDEELDQAKKRGAAPKPDLYLKIAADYERAKQPDKAVQELVSLTHVAPDDPTGFAELGHLYERLGKTEEAVSALNKASQRDTDPKYGLEAAELYRQAGKLDQAAAEYEALQPRFGHDARVLSPLAQTLEASGKDEQALAIYDSLLKVDPTLNWAEDRKATILTRLKRYDEARDLREKRIARDPTSQQDYSDLSHLYALQGKSPAYLAWLQARAVKHPEDATLLAALLDEYSLQKHADEGWTFLKQMVGRHQNERPVLVAYVTVLERNGRSADAPAVFQRIAALDPNDLSALDDYADSLIANGQKEQALQVYRTQIARSDLSAATRLQLRRKLAQRLELQGDTSDAISQYQQIVSAQPQDFDAISSLVRLFNAAGRSNEIIATCNSLLSRFGNPPTLRAQLLSFLGAAYEKQNNRDEALQQYHEALKANPDDPVAAAAIKRLGG